MRVTEAFVAFIGVTIVSIISELASGAIIVLEFDDIRLADVVSSGCRHFDIVEVATFPCTVFCLCLEGIGWDIGDFVA
jgi:hypothetical protein